MNYKLQDNEKITDYFNLVKEYYIPIGKEIFHSPKYEGIVEELIDHYVDVGRTIVALKTYPACQGDKASEEMFQPFQQLKQDTLNECKAKLPEAEKGRLDIVTDLLFNDKMHHVITDLPVAEEFWSKVDAMNSAPGGQPVNTPTNMTNNNMPANMANNAANNMPANMPTLRVFSFPEQNQNHLNSNHMDSNSMDLNNSATRAAEDHHIA